MGKIFKILICLVMTFSFMFGAMVENKTQFYNTVLRNSESIMVPVHSWFESKGIINNINQWFTTAKIGTAICYVIITDGFKWHWVRGP